MRESLPLLAEQPFKHPKLVPIMEWVADLMSAVFYRQLFLQVTEFRTFVFFQASRSCWLC